MKSRIFDAKGLFWNLIFPYYVYSVKTLIEILYLYIRGAGWKVVYVLRVCMVKTRAYPPRVGTAATVGAIRVRVAIGPLASVSFEIFLTPVIFL